MNIDQNTRVAVLMGGLSAERDISLKSGKAVLQALQSRGFNAVGLDVGPDLPAQLREEGVEVAWIALHGLFGEDGCVQGMLELMRIPYTGSGVQGSAIAIDKVATKRFLEGSGVRLPADVVWRKGQPVPQDVQYPVVAKFPEGGSTLGLAICQDRAALEAALAELGEMGDQVLLEQFVSGHEITVAVLDGRALPVVGIVPESGTFDFEAKYTKGRTRYDVPAKIDARTAMHAQRQAELSYSRLGLCGIARADFIVDEQGVPWFLEINTSPGMTATSLSPMAAGETGLSFEDLVVTLLRGAKLHLRPA